MIVRSARSEDVPSVARLYHRVWHESHGPLMPNAERDTRTGSFFLDRIERLMPNVIVGDISGARVGFAAWDDCVLGQLFVDAAHRGSGVAPRLLRAAEDGLFRAGVAGAELRCLVGNARARRFYEREGWAVGDVVTESTGGSADREDRHFWVMRKRLGAKTDRSR